MIKTERHTVIDAVTAREISDSQPKARAWMNQIRLSEGHQIVIDGHWTFAESRDFRRRLAELLHGRNMYVRSSNLSQFHTTSEPPPEPPLILEPETFVQESTKFAAASDLDFSEIESRPLHLVHARKALYLHHRQKSLRRPLTRDEKEKRVQGYCAEVVFQKFLSHFCVAEGAIEDCRVRLPDKNDFLRLRSGIGFGSGWSIEQSQAGSFLLRGPDQCPTEIDAILLTGLDPEHPENFCGMYLFDVTTSTDYFNQKITKAISCPGFVDWMRQERNVECDEFTVLMTNPNTDVPHLKSPTDAERRHSLILPFLRKVRGLALGTLGKLK